MVFRCVVGMVDFGGAIYPFEGFKPPKGYNYLRQYLMKKKDKNQPKYKKLKKIISQCNLLHNNCVIITLNVSNSGHSYCLFCL